MNNKLYIWKPALERNEYTIFLLVFSTLFSYSYFLLTLSLNRAIGMKNHLEMTSSRAHNTQQHYVWCPSRNQQQQNLFTVMPRAHSHRMYVRVNLFLCCLDHQFIIYTFFSRLLWISISLSYTLLYVLLIKKHIKEIKKRARTHTHNK